MSNHNFNYEETLSIRQYDMIIDMASNRIRIYRKHASSSENRWITHMHIKRDINMIRHCRKMITLIQSQLN